MCPASQAASTPQGRPQGGGASQNVAAIAANVAVAATRFGLRSSFGSGSR